MHHHHHYYYHYCSFVCITYSATRITDEGELEEVADVLGKSAVIIQDVKEKRLKNYRFDWNKILRFEGQTGVFLQYTHARLCR